MLFAITAALILTSCEVNKPAPDPTPDKTKPEIVDPLTEGLVVHYKFDDTNAPGVDSSGRSNAATAATGKSLPTINEAGGKVGVGAARLESSSAFLVDLSRDTKFKSSTDSEGLSFAFWLYKDNYNTASHQLLLNTQETTLAEGQSTFSLCVDGRANDGREGYIIFDRGGRDFGQQDAASPLTVNSWNHVAIVKNQTTWTMYINGNELHSANLPGDFNPANFVIGNGNANGSFAGLVDDFRLYERALTLDEVKKLAAQ